MTTKRKHAYWKKVVPFGGLIKRGDVEVLDKWVCSHCGLAMHGRSAEICPSCLSIMDAKPEDELCQHPKDWSRVIS